MLLIKVMSCFLLSQVFCANVFAKELEDLTRGSFDLNHFITFESTEFNHGILEQNSVSQHDFVGINISDQIITISKAFAGCPACVDVKVEDKVIDPGEELIVQTFFKTKNRQGKYTKSVIIKTDLNDVRPQKFILKAAVLPPEEFKKLNDKPYALSKTDK